MAGLAVAAVIVFAAEMMEPQIYVGVRACLRCHRGDAAGHQFSLWRLSKHAQAYAVLALPESKEIARLSGIREEPQTSPMCLGCHATGAEAEEWQRDESFRIEDGVQCEKCHGPRSDHVDTMMAGGKSDVAAEMKMMTPKPDEAACMMCHIEKGSHVAVLKVRKFDYDKSWKQIAHPSPRQKQGRTNKASTRASATRGAAK